MAPRDGAQTQGAPDRDGVSHEAPGVLRIVWADPAHMAEHIAVWSLEHLGPRAGAAVEKVRRTYPEADPTELERLVIERQTRVATAEGALVGGPFLLLIPLAFCAALLAQAQMTFELAAVAGLDPTDELRAADLLVLLGAYASTADARAGLAAMARETHARKGKRLPSGARWGMVVRMAYLLTLVTPPDESQGRIRVALGWIGVSFVCLVGFVLPLVWLPYMAVSMRRGTIRLGDRARAHFAADVVADGGGGVPVRRKGGLRIGGASTLVRALLGALFPFLVVLGAVFAGRSVGVRVDSLLDVVVVLLVASAIGTAAWAGLRWWRLRRSHVAAARA